MNPAHDNRLNLDAYDMEAHETMPLVKRKLSRGLSTISHHHQEDGISKTNGADMAHSTKMALYYAAINGLCFGVLAVWAYSYQFENWTIIDSLYFAVCTFTTVGYGDLSPSSESSRIFTCFFAVYGIAILGFFINIIGARLVTLHQEAINDAERLNTMKAANMFDEDDNTQSNGIMEKKKLLEENERDTQRLAHYSAFYVIIKALVGQLPIILIVLGVAVLMGKMEGWSVANGIYFGVVTASTVGYGDVTPVTTHMKAVAIVILPMMVAVFCEVLGCVAGAYLKFKVAQEESKLLDKKLTVEDLIKMDTDADGSVNYGEFLSFMLLAMNKVEEEDLSMLKEIFERLDRSGDGLLDKDDLIKPNGAHEPDDH